MIIGGEAIYGAFLPVATRLHLTLVDTAVEGGDARFPDLDESDWEEIASEYRAPDEKNAFPMTFRELVRREAAT